MKALSIEFGMATPNPLYHGRHTPEHEEMPEPKPRIHRECVGFTALFFIAAAIALWLLWELDDVVFNAHLAGITYLLLCAFVLFPAMTSASIVYNENGNVSTTDSKIGYVCAGLLLCTLGLHKIRMANVLSASNTAQQGSVSTKQWEYGQCIQIAMAKMPQPVCNDFIYDGKLFLGSIPPHEGVQLTKQDIAVVLETAKPILAGIMIDVSAKMCDSIPSKLMCSSAIRPCNRICGGYKIPLDECRKTMRKRKCQNDLKQYKPYARTLNALMVQFRDVRIFKDKDVEEAAKNMVFGKIGNLLDAILAEEDICQLTDFVSADSNESTLNRGEFVCSSGRNEDSGEARSGASGSVSARSVVFVSKTLLSTLLVLPCFLLFAERGKGVCRAPPEQSVQHRSTKVSVAVATVLLSVALALCAGTVFVGLENCGTSCISSSNSFQFHALLSTCGLKFVMQFPLKRRR